MPSVQVVVTRLRASVIYVALKLSWLKSEVFTSRVQEVSKLRCEISRLVDFYIYEFESYIIEQLQLLDFGGPE